jgi:hypothetical protein
VFSVKEQKGKNIFGRLVLHTSRLCRYAARSISHNSRVHTSWSQSRQVLDERVRGDVVTERSLTLSNVLVTIYTTRINVEEPCILHIEFIYEFRMIITKVKLSLCLIKHYAMKAYGVVDV